MKCSSCGIESINLRAYVPVMRAAGNDIVQLCAACRVLNALHAHYLAVAGCTDVAAPVGVAAALDRPPPAPALQESAPASR